MAQDDSPNKQHEKKKKNRDGFRRHKQNMGRLPKTGLYSSCLVHNYFKLKIRIRNATNTIPNGFSLLKVSIQEVGSDRPFFCLRNEELKQKRQGETQNSDAIAVSCHYYLT